MNKQRRQIPKEWKKILDKQGFTSIRKLAKASGINHNAVGALIYSEVNSSDYVIISVAKALNVPVTKIYELAQKNSTEASLEEWQLPPESYWLTLSQKQAIENLIKTLGAPAKNFNNSEQHASTIKNILGVNIETLNKLSEIQKKYLKTIIQTMAEGRPPIPFAPSQTDPYNLAIKHGFKELQENNNIPTPTTQEISILAANTNKELAEIEKDAL